jgi:ABC-type lipoprotein export system ATPase subunit
VSFTIVFEDDDPADDGTVPDSASANPDEGSEQVQDRALTVGTDPDNKAEHEDSQTHRAPSHPGTAHRTDDAKSSDDILSPDSAQLAPQAEDSPAAASPENSKDVDVTEESSSDPLMKVSSRINAEIHRRSTLRIDQYPVLSLNKVTYFPKKSGFAILDDMDWPFYGGSLQTVLTDADDARTAVAGLLIGLVLPTSGSVEFRGKNLSEMEASEYRGHLVGVMLQRFASRDELSALENLVLTMEASGRNFLKPIPVIAKGWLARVDFPEARINEPVHTLAALDRRRAEIARTLCCDATVLILDEPSGGLEHQDAVTVMKLLTSLAQEQDRCIVVLTSQDDVAQYGETIYEA